MRNQDYEEYGQGKEDQNDASSYSGGDVLIEGGPVKERQSTDSCWIYVFLLGLLTFGILVVVAVSNSNFKNLTAYYDSDNRVCGLTASTSKYPYVYFLNRTDGSNTSKRVCVLECPSNFEQDIQCLPTKNVPNCNLLKLNGYKTTPFLDSLCVSSEGYDQVKKYLDSGLQEFLAELKKNIVVILIVALISLLLSLVCLLILQYCAGCVIYTFLVLIVLLPIVFGINFMIQGGADAKDSEFSEDSRAGFMVLGLILLCIGLLISCCICCCFKKVKFLVALTETTSKFILENLTSLLVPIIGGIANMGFQAIYIVAMINLYACANPVQSSPNSPNSTLQLTTGQEIISYYSLFIFYWGSFFINYLTQFIISFAVCIWYFTEGREGSSLTESISAIFKYHLGSVALGSLIVAVIRIIANALRSLGRESKNETVRLILKLIVDLLERFIQYIGAHAYIEMALKGTSFWPSCVQGFKVVTKNFVTFGVSVGMFDLLNFICTLTITLISMVLGYLLITKTSFSHDINTPLLFMIIFFVLSLIICHLFFSVWGMVADTLVHCFCVEEELGKKQYINKKAPESLNRVMLENKEQIERERQEN